MIVISPASNVSIHELGVTFLKYRGDFGNARPPKRSSPPGTKYRRFAMKIRTVSTLAILGAASALFMAPGVVAGSIWQDQAVIRADSVSGTIEKYDAPSNTFTLRT